MSLQAKTFLNLLAGGLAGLLAWALTDLTGWFSDVLNASQVVNGGKYLGYGAVFGALLGLLLALIETLALESRRRIANTLALGAGIGACGGLLGLFVGQSVYGVVAGGGGNAITSAGRFFALLLARALGWALIGATVGAAQGAGSRSAVVARQGAVGGLVGGFLGGTGFEILNGLGFSAPISRLAALVATGALAGFFVGLVQNLFKQAWVRLVLGRNEGKEYLLAKPITTIGRSELADISLFGDPGIAPTHLVIEALAPQNRHRLRFAGEGGQRGAAWTPPLVNGQPVAGEQWLTDGDTIQVGKRTLLFHEKVTRKEGPVSDLVGTWPPPPSQADSSQAGPGNPTPTASGAEGPRYVGQALSESANAAPRPSLTTPAEVIAQMGVAPTSDAAIPGSAGDLGSRLLCTQGPYAGQSFPLRHAPVTIGRASDRDISLSADTSVSRAHARIVYQNSRHLVSDDGSSNGTFVNGARVGEARLLNPGDTLQLGDTTFRYE